MQIEFEKKYANPTMGFAKRINYKCDVLNIRDVANMQYMKYLLLLVQRTQLRTVKIVIWFLKYHREKGRYNISAIWCILSHADVWNISRIFQIFRAYCIKENSLDYVEYLDFIERHKPFELPVGRKTFSHVSSIIKICRSYCEMGLLILKVNWRLES